MKIQLIILAMFVVATLAHRDRDGDDSNRVERRRGRWGRRGGENDRQMYADAEEASEMEDAIPTEGDQVVDERAGKKGCGGRRGYRGGHRGNNRGWPSHRGEAGEKNVGEGGPQFSHDPEWHKQHGVAMPDNNNEGGDMGHHRHHHHHHRHHHHNRTTTVPTTTSAAPASSTAEFEEK